MVLRTDTPRRHPEATAGQPMAPAPEVTLTPRARQLLGRMMASTGRVWLVDTALRPEVEHRLAQRWGDGEAAHRGSP